MIDSATLRSLQAESMRKDPKIGQTPSSKDTNESDRASSMLYHFLDRELYDFQPLTWLLRLKIV